MNHKDSSIRKQWLFLWVVTTFIGIIAPILQIGSHSASQVPIVIRYASSLTSMLIGVIFAVVSYRCSYRKPGIKFLTFLIIVNLVGMLYTYASLLLGWVAPPTFIPHFKLYMVVSQVINILWLIACLRIRNVNKRLMREPDL